MNFLAAGLSFFHPWTWVKSAVKKKIIAIIQEEGDAFQKTLDEKIAKEGPAAFDKYFDAAQAKIVERINAL